MLLRALSISLLCFFCFACSKSDSNANSVTAASIKQAFQARVGNYKVVSDTKAGTEGTQCNSAATALIAFDDSNAAYVMTLAATGKDCSWTNGETLATAKGIPSGVNCVIQTDYFYCSGTYQGHHVEMKTTLKDVAGELLEVELCQLGTDGVQYSRTLMLRKL